MKIIAGGRGSGKTYELIHLAAKDPEALFVAKDRHTARYLRNEYRSIIRPDRIIVQEDLAYPYKFRGMGMSYLKSIYVDDLPSGFDIPNMWMDEYHIAAVAVQAESAHQNIHLPDSYLEAATKMEKERRDQKKTLEVDKT